MPPNTPNNTNGTNICTAPNIAMDTSNLTQYVTADDVKFYVPNFTSDCNITSIGLIVTYGPDLALYNTGYGWIAMPNIPA